MWLLYALIDKYVMLAWQIEAQPTALLTTGAHIPLFGLGTFKADAKTTNEAVAAALRSGVIHLDCASRYGNQPVIGNGLQAAFKQGSARREDVFITSKLW